MSNRSRIGSYDKPYRVEHIRELERSGLPQVWFKIPALGVESITKITWRAIVRQVEFK
jgi:hypothetical protein